jgi:hypothetical protein
MKKNPTIESLRAGQTVYLVHALGKASFVNKSTITGKPTCKRNGRKFHHPFFSISYFSDISYLSENFKIENDLSTKDCNLIPNSYNHHRLFYSRKKAQRYLNRCLTENIDLVHKIPYTSFDPHYANWDDNYSDYNDDPVFDSCTGMQ